MQVWWKWHTHLIQAQMPTGIKGSTPFTCTRNSCPAKLYNDCGEAKALADKGQPHELEYCAGRLMVGRQTHYLEATFNSFVRTHSLRRNSRRGWILRFNYHRLPSPTVMADNEDMWLCHLPRV